MYAYFDTSALVKLYHEEKGSRFAVEFAAAQPWVIISRLGMVEAHSALAGKVRTGVISPEAADATARRLLSDVRKRRLRVVALRIRHYELAQELIQQFGVRHSLRTLDSLQLATAIDLARGGVVSTFVSADRNLPRAAADASESGLLPELGCVDPESRE